MAKNQKMQQTTGKVYKNDGNDVFCKTCGTIYDSDKDRCPDCGGKEKAPYHQTTARVPKKAT